MNIKIVEDKISLQELREVAKEFYSTMIKGVVDVEKEIAAFGGEYHADANEMLSWLAQAKHKPSQSAN